MTVFDIEEKQGVWLDMKDGGRVQLKTLANSDWLKIRKATLKVVPFVQMVDGKHQVFNQEIVDEELQQSMISDMTIVSWENLFDKNKNPIPCTPENKVILMTMKNESFRNFVTEKMKELSEAESGAKEVQEKNVLTT